MTKLPFGEDHCGQASQFKMETPGLKTQNFVYTGASSINVEIEDRK